MGSKLYVGNLSYNTTGSDLEQLFSAHGAVQSAEIIADRDTGRSKGFGFVQMGSDDEAQAAIAALNGTQHDGRALTVNEARPREDARVVVAAAAVAVAVLAVAAVKAAAASAVAVTSPQSVPRKGRESGPFCFSLGAIGWLMFHAGGKPAHVPAPANRFPDGSLEPGRMTTRIASLIGVLLPFVGFIVAIVLLWGRGFGWIHGVLLLGMYIASAVGVTVGYHRYFCHRAFQTPRVVHACWFRSDRWRSRARCSSGWRCIAATTSTTTAGATRTHLARPATDSLASSADCGMPISAGFSKAILAIFPATFPTFPAIGCLAS